MAFSKCFAVFVDQVVWKIQTFSVLVSLGIDISSANSHDI